MTVTLAIHFAYPTWGFLLALLVALAFVWMTYQPASPYFSTAKRFLLGALRFFSLLVVCLLIWQPQWERRVQEVQKPVLSVALDRSKSMTLHTNDSLFDYSAELKELRSKLSDRYDIDVVGFHERIVDGDSIVFTGRETDFSAVTRYASKRYQRDHLAALLILTDGIPTTGTRPEALGNTIEAPVFSLIYGDTLPKPDAAVERIVHNSFVYVGNQVEVQAELSFTELEGHNPVVRILRDGEDVLRETLTAISQRRSLVPFTAVVPGANEEGLISYELLIEPAESEAFTSNNARTFYVDAMRNKKRIGIIAAAPHPDIGALRSALSSLEHYEVEVFMGKQNTIPEDIDVLVLHNTRISAEQTQRLTQQRVGVLHILGPRSNPDMIGGLFSLAGTGGDDFERARPVFRGGFSTFKMDPWWQANASDLPPLQTYFPRGSAISGSNVLASASIEGIATDRPLMGTGTLNDAPNMVINGLGIWQWRIKVYTELGAHRVFDDWMASSFRYLSTVQRDERLQLFHARRHREGQPIRVDARLYDASFEPTTASEVSLTIFENDVPAYNYAFVPQGNQYALDIKGLSAGTYAYRAETTLGAETFTAKGTLIVEAYQSEFVRTTAQIAGLRILAEETGGNAQPHSRLSTIVEDLQALPIKKILKERIKRAPLIDFWWLLLLLLLTLTAEWYLRRRAGSY